MPGNNKVFPFIFVFILLFLAVTVKSGVIVDRSFLPRFLLLSLLLLFTIIFYFRFRIILKNTVFEWSFLLFCLWNLLSYAWSQCPSEVLNQSGLVFLAFAVYLVISSFVNNDPRFEIIFIRIFLFVLMYSFALGFITMSRLPFFDPYKIVSVSANNNLYSGFLLISIPLILAGYALNKGIWKYFAVLTAILAVFFIIILQSRAVYLGLFVSAAIAGIMILLRYSRILTRKNLLTGALSLVLLCSGVLVFYSSLDQTRKNYFLSKIPVWQYFRSYDDVIAEKVARQLIAKGDLTRITAFDFSEDYYENANLRMIFWKKSLGLIKSNPLIGVGSGNWKINIPSVKDPPNPDHTLKNYTYSYPHNEWIGIIAELGIIGFILSLFIFFVPPGIALVRIFDKRKRFPVSALFYSSFILGFCVFAAFDFPFKRVEHTIIFFSVLAFLLNKVPFNVPKPLIPSLLVGRGRPKVGVGMLDIFIIILLAFSVVISSFRLKGEYYTLKMFTEERKNDHLVIDDCRAAGNFFYRVTPNSLPLDWFEGVAWYRLGDVDHSLQCYRNALACTPYEVRVLNDYGVSLYQSHQVPEAKSVLIRTIGLDPWFDDARFNLGAIYYWSGRRDSALYYVQNCRASPKKTDFLKELQ